MRYRYIPILRWKLGEKKGLKRVSEPMSKDVCPLIVVTEETFADQPETARSEAMTASFLFADELTKHWGARPFYFDASNIRPSSEGAHPLIEAAKECRHQGARMMPATRLLAPDAYDAAVLNVVNTDKCGVALTVSLREFTTAAEWVHNWPHALKDTDLILDLEDKVATVADLGSALDMAFRNLHGAGRWRSVTIAGTSMPENFGDYDKDDTHLIERTEWTLWQHLIALSLPYRLDYGDYATVAVTGAPSEVRTGFPINVRYTLPTQFLVCRGVRTRGEGSRDQSTQLIAHAKTIVKYRGRNPLNCWADNTIDKIAAKKEGPSGLTHWVTIAVNRHITRVRTDIP
jgi:Beta protein